MPALCAFGCRPSDVPMHRFPDPNKFPERFKTWVALVGGKLETPEDYEHYKKKRACDKHFNVNDHNRNNRLNALAIPSLFLAGFYIREPFKNITNIPADANPSGQSQANISEGIQHPNIMPGTSQSSDYVMISSLPAETTEFLVQPAPSSIQHPNIMPGTSQSSSLPSETTEFLVQPAPSCQTPDIPIKSVLAEHNYTAASRTKEVKRKYLNQTTFLCGRTRKMHTQIKYLRSEICRLRRKGKFSTRLESATKISNDAIFKQVVQVLAKPAQLFINMQLQGSKKTKGRRFTLEEKIMCLSLYKKGPKCYALLQKYFTLPSAKAMKRLLGKIKLTPGINPILFQKIKKTLAEKNTEDKLCSLAFDEMSLTAQVNFNSQKDTLEGFACNNEDEFANHALVFMVKGLKQNFKQPIAYYFTRQLNKSQLKTLIQSVVSHAQDSGLIIVNTVCDQSTVNVSAINELVNDTRSSYLRKNKEWRHDCFSVNGHEIIPIFDAPHLIKGIRNNLLTKDMLYTICGQEKRVKWEYFQKVHESDKTFGNLKLLHKITEEHVDPSKINKMRVKTATQIFSHSVAVVTEHLTARGNLPNECRDLIDITLLLDDLFDSLNVSSILVPDGKKYKGGVRKNSPHHKLWGHAKQVLKTVKFVNKEKSSNKVRFTECVVPSIKNLIRTIEGMEAIWNVVSRQYGYDVLLTRNLNQDPVENFFGNIRSYGARNNAPNTISFEGAFKALLLNNYFSPHSKGANCEEDKNNCLQSFDFFIKENCLTPDDNADIPVENIVINDEVLEPRAEVDNDAGQRNYVCGWVVKKCLQQICKSCQNCRKNLLDGESQCNEKNNYIKAKEYNNKKWLCYPNDTTSNCFHELQTITCNFLKNVPKKNLRHTIVQFCDMFVMYPFSCIEHKNELQKHFVITTINILIFSWCRTINRILSGKIQYEGDEEYKKKAAMYYNKYKHYKNKK